MQLLPYKYWLAVQQSALKCNLGIAIACEGKGAKGVVDTSSRIIIGIPSGKSNRLGIGYLLEFRVTFVVRKEYLRSNSFQNSKALDSFE
jgi:hypothetical protein